MTPTPLPIAIIANSQTPYRLHLHQRIAREIPEIKLWSIFTHEQSDSPWSLTSPAEIGPVMLGKGEGAVEQAKFSNALKEWRRGGRVIRFLIDKDVRAIVMMGYNDLGRARIMRWCHAHGIKCFLFGDSNIRGDLASGMKAKIKQLYLRRVLNWCDAVLACGSLGKEYFKKYGADTDRIFYFPYEPNYEQIQSIGNDFQRTIEDKYSISTHRRRIIYSGRLVDVKRVDLLIEAFNHISVERANWDLIIVGDGPLRESLQKRVTESISARVNWTGFIGDQATISALYRCADVLVLPSDVEPWALVINEGTAAGLAIVSSDVVGASAELVRDGVNGRLFPAGNLKDFIDALLDVTADENIDRYKNASTEVLADWRKRGDPIDGLRKALRSVSLM